MAEVVYIQPPAQAQPQVQEGTLDRLIRYGIYLIIIALLVGVIVGLYLVIENWEWIVTTVTTGFIGWLNPFDSREGDTGPLAVIDETVGFSDALSLALWWPPNWFK